jgi:hypothetical protein
MRLINKLSLAAVFATAALTFGQTAKDDMKKAGEGVKDAGKATGHAAKEAGSATGKTAKKAGHKVKKGTHDAAGKTKPATNSRSGFSLTTVAWPGVRLKPDLPFLIY